MNSLLSILSIFGFLLVHTCNASICFMANGIKPYNKDYNVCCGGALLLKTENLNCCGGEKEYFTDKKECCGDQLFPINNNYLCCNGIRTKLSEDQAKLKDSLSCCGSEAFDSQTHMCCMNTIMVRNESLGCCNNKTFNTAISYCNNNAILGKTEDFCNGQIYNRLEDTCCRDYSLPKPSGKLIKHKPELLTTAIGSHILNRNAECCGESVIDNKKFYCCHRRYNYGYPTHSIPNNFDFSCCGNGYYNRTSQFCIGGITSKKSPNKARCGNKVINTQDQGCCSDKLPYNLTTEQCCEGIHYCVISKSQKCCNGLKMENDELCCQDVQPCVKRNKNDNDCCFNFQEGYGQTYNNKEKKCIRGKLVFFPGSEYRPCGPKDFFNPSKEYCCGNKVYDNHKGQCCEGKFNKIPAEKGKCCIIDKRVYKNDKNNPCIKNCNKKPYDIHTQLCCEGNIFEYTGNNYCCGKFAIDPEIKSCCGNYWHFRTRSHKGCCLDRQVYNKRYSRCNANGNVESIGEMENLSDVEKICYPLGVKLFDSAMQHACRRKHAISGKIVDVHSFFKKKNGFKVRIKLRRVRYLKENNADIGDIRKLEFHIHIPSNPNACSTVHLKKLKRVIILFDDDIKNKIVNISMDSHFFLIRKTLRRSFAVTKAATKVFCKVY